MKYENRIYKTLTIPANCSTENLNYLYECNRESARIWNDCVKISKNLWETQEKRPDQNYFQQIFKMGYSDILSVKSMQLISKKYLSNVNGIIKARKAGRIDCRYPYKEKRMYNTLYDYMNFQIDYNKSIIKLARPKIKNKQGKIVNQKPIIIYVKTIPQNVIIIEIKYDNGLKLCLNYYEENKQEKNNIQKQNFCAVDMGEIHSIVSIDNNGNNVIITAREIRSVQRFRNKELAKLNRKLRKCKKGSRNYKRYRKAIVKLCSKANAKMNYLLHKTSKLFINHVKENNIKEVIIGDLTNFNRNQKNTKNRKGAKQKLIQWPHGKLKQKLQYKLERENIGVIEISESYTSQTCPACGHRHKPKGRNYVCKCGYKNHRDIVGAINILSKYINGEIKSMNLPHKPIKYLRIA